MFIRSLDGKHLVEAHSIDLDGAKILVNGEVFGEFASEMEALGTFVELSQEVADCETFFDLSGEISSDYDDDDDFDDDDDDGDFDIVFG